jgi:Cu/Ag efflux pump CusA
LAQALVEALAQVQVQVQVQVQGWAPERVAAQLVLPGRVAVAV